MEHIVNRHGLDMPKLGLGTWPMVGEDCTRAVVQALELGYRHIDTAAGYQNEDAVGAALSATTVPREQIHVTSKVWWDQLEPQALRASCERSLRDLRSDYVDLFLLHWPTTDMNLRSTLDALVGLKERGLARAVGVANFPLPLLKEAVETIGAPLAALQVEYHVTLGQTNLLEFARRHDMALTAYSPLARNRVSEIPAIVEIARKHNVLPTQIALAWLLEQKNVAAVPKAAGAANQTSNLASLDVRLDDEDRATIAALPKNERLVNPAFAPQWDDAA
ncbi:aldo/keto reductase [Burkholderia sp. Ac-20365]|uniref:aldo/keto reductase n=1 Tax=Burkholderia sp. Ac-20365 TaxID=2703897 RepID=UPI00197B3896|nr:aldo/keto reductase [Burkholderia sp. Ac-20365]MBN3763760.1 aldo/keto reductase [Burkholderia sp. Ac-20365]